MQVAETFTAEFSAAMLQADEEMMDEGDKDTQQILKEM